MQVQSVFISSARRWVSTLDDAVVAFVVKHACKLNSLLTIYDFERDSTVIDGQILQFLIKV